MKHRVEHCIQCRGWVVLNPRGSVVYEANTWECALDDALARYRDALMRQIRSR